MTPALSTLRYCLLVPCFKCVSVRVFFFQHQQQVVQAVERAKQVTMAELNAVIGVRGLPGLPPTVCIPLFILTLQHKNTLCGTVYYF